MRLRDFALLTDENIHPGVLKVLRREGYDVLDVKESKLTGDTDLAILRKAVSENRVVLTHDSDFGRLAIATSEPIIGIIYLRPGHIDPVFTLETLSSLFREAMEVAPPFIVVAERSASQVKIRVRHL